MASPTLEHRKTPKDSGQVGTFQPELTARGEQRPADDQAGVLAERESPPLVVLVIRPAPKPGRYLGHVGDELIVTSRQPFVDGARALLSRGCDPATPYNMRRANSDVLSFVTTTIGHAAGLSVNEARTRFQKFVPFKGLADEEDGETHGVTAISSQRLLDALQGDDVAISELKATLAEPPPPSPAGTGQDAQRVDRTGVGGGFR
jgi:hypothetical protein